MKEFRLVLYMNATDSINFWGGRAAASPLAYYFYLRRRKHKKVILSGSFRFIGLGKYRWLIKEALENTPRPIRLPYPLADEQILISERAYIYQNTDPLFSQAPHEVYWEAKIHEIGKFKRAERYKYTLGAVKIGLNTHHGQEPEDSDNEWRALVSDLVRFKKPVPKDNCPWKIYAGNDYRGDFWNDRGTPSVPRNNVFVHMSKREWEKFDDTTEREKALGIKEVTNHQIRHTRIRESLVHELLKMIFAREGWWVNYEIPIKDGRIDFMVKRNPKSLWTIIEVKLEDNPNAVEQLHTYIEHIVEDVKESKSDSYFWPLWRGGQRKPKGVVLCAAPGGDTCKEAKPYNYDVWTYKYTFRDNKLGLIIRDAQNGNVVVRTR